MSTGCEFYADALVELTRGELDSERAERVEGHLAGCEACRASMAVIRAVRAAPAPVPEGLEERLLAAVAGAGAAGTGPAAGEDDRGTRGSPSRAPRPGRSWKRWSLPVAAAAALALWFGANGLLSPDTTGGLDTAVEYDPYGAWPASDGVVAGEVVLSELTVEELEALLEEMQS